MRSLSKIDEPVALPIAAIVVLTPLVFWPSLRDYTLGPKLLVLQILLALLLCLALFSNRSIYLYSPIGLPALCYVLIAFASITYASDPTVALLEASKLLSGFVLFFILSNYLTPANLPQMLTACVLGAIPVSLLGLADHVGLRPFAIPSAGLPSATLGYRNIAAMYLIQTLPLAAVMFWLTPRRYAAYLFALTFAIMAAFLIHTRTRGAWLGLIIATVLVAFLIYIARQRAPIARPSFAPKKGPFALALLLIGALAIAPPGHTKHGPQSIDEKKTTIGAAISSIVHKGGDRGRLQVWNRTLSMLIDFPLLGVGLGNWSVIYPRYDQGMRITFESAPERPHNDLLSIASELGLIGLACYLWFWIAVVHTGWRLIRSERGRIRWVASACLASFLAISIHSLFSFPKERMTPIVFFWLVAGALAALERSDHTIPEPTGRVLLVGMLGLTLAQIGFTARLIRFEAHMYRAVQAEKSTQWETVATETGRALARGRFHPEAIHLRGYALNALGQYNAAFSHYREAVKKRPNDVQINNGLAIAAQNLGQFALAEKHYRRVLDIIDDSDVYYNLAGLYLQSSRPQEAAEAYRKVLNREGPSLDVLYYLIHAYLFARETDRAAEILERALAFAPESANAHFEWIETLYRRHRNPAIAQACYMLFADHWTGPAEDRERARKRARTLNPSTEKKPE